LLVFFSFFPPPVFAGLTKSPALLYCSRNSGQKSYFFFNRPYSGGFLWQEFEPRAE